MSIAEKLAIVAIGQQNVYDAGHNNGYSIGFKEGMDISFEEGFEEGYNEGYDEGHADGKSAEYNAFWDAYQENGNRTAYYYAFSSQGWNDTTFVPKYDIKPINSERTFYDCEVTNLAEQLEKCGVMLDTSNASTVSYIFASSRTSRIPPVSMVSATITTAAFGWTSYLITIDKIILKEDGTTPIANNWFNGTTKLENIIIEGVIGQNNFTVSTCSKLTHDSLMSIINALADYSEDTSGTAWKVTIGSTNKAKLTDAELQIAYDKGWTVS